MIGRAKFHIQIITATLMPPKTTSLFHHFTQIQHYSQLLLHNI